METPQGPVKTFATMVGLKRTVDDLGRLLQKKKPEAPIWRPRALSLDGSPNEI